jgi:hypothetical protein
MGLVGDVVDVQGAALGLDAAEEVLESAGAHAGEAADGDLALDFGDGGVHDLGPGVEAPAEHAVAALGVAHVRVLGEHGFDEHVEAGAFADARWDGVAVHLPQATQDLAELLLLQLCLP